PDDAALLVQNLAAAVQAMHEQRIVHRDLKPGNVLLTADGTPKVTDFGLARALDESGLTQQGALVGTPAYMSPEQALGRTEQLGPVCDIYALGAILYECLAGRPPFRGGTALDTLQQVVGEKTVPPRRLNSRVPADLEGVCLKCLEKEPDRRYGSAGELAEELA